MLADSFSGGLIVLPAGSFTVAFGGNYANPGGVVINLGTTTVNGAMTASVLNAGTLGGTSNIAGSVLNVGTVAPGQVRDPGALWRALRPRWHTISLRLVLISGNPHPTSRRPDGR